MQKNNRRDPAVFSWQRLATVTARMLTNRHFAPHVIASLVFAGIYFTWRGEAYLIFVLALVAINVIVGVGLNVLVGLSGQISFGHVGFFALGAYVSGITMLEGQNFWIALGLAAFFSTVCGALMALPALRVSGPYLAMMTIAFAFIVEHGLIEWKGLTGGSNGLMGFPSPTFFGITMSERGLAVLAIVLAGLALLLYYRLASGRWGLAMCAVRDSDTAAQSLGYNPVVIKTVSFALSASLTGIAGAVFAPLVMFISPGSFPFSQSILFILAVVVGGAGTIFGPVLGAGLVVVLPELLSDFAEYRLLIFGVLLLVVLWAAPGGIVGTISSRLKKDNPGTASGDKGRAETFLRKTAHGNYPLNVVDLAISFGGIQAAKNVSFTATPGNITSIIGPNGAGKTTVLNMIGGFYKPSDGVIELGEDLAGAPAWSVARHGISRTYQTTLLFEQLTVQENLLIAMNRGHLGFLLSGAGNKQDRILVEDILGFVGYTGPLEVSAGSLPHVDKRLVEIARALITNPSVLLLDEPAAGLMKSDKILLSRLLRKIAELGVTIILVEHDMPLVMEISDHVVVLDAGTLLMSGIPADVYRNEKVLRAYLGGHDYQGRPRVLTASAGEMAILSTLKLTAGYGAAPVLEDADLLVKPGETVAVLGANGAGKSTMMRAISGLHRPVSGSIILNDKEVKDKAAHEIARAGVSLVPEGRQVFPELTVLDNMLLGAYSTTGIDLPTEVERLLERFPRLRERLDSKAGVLSGGEQQMLAIARGLIGKPAILLLDEPSLGLAPAMINELFDILADLRDEGVTILIVDQMANLALAVADRGYLLESGTIVNSGPASELRDDPGIQQAYLGSAQVN